MKKILSIIAAMCLCIGVYAQTSDFDYVFLNNGSVVKGVIENEVPNVSVTIRATNGETYTYQAIEVKKVAHGQDPKIPKVTKKDNTHTEYTRNNTGFWFAAELQGGYSTQLNRSNLGLTELDVVLGYRFNEFVRVGAGIGGRYYFGDSDYGANDRVRDRTTEWSFPLFANVRGNFISQEYRKVVPYYSIDLGGTFRDGFMFRPTVGIRVGEPRAAFLLGVSYLGQSINGFKNDLDRTPETKFMSGITLKVGYEF